MFLNKRHFYANGFLTSPLALLWRRLFWLSSVALVAIVFVFLFGPSVVLSRTSAVADLVTEPGPDLNLSIAGGTNNISLDVAPLDSNGTFRTSDANTNNISVSTNNYTGYTLGISAKAASEGDITHSSDLTFDTTDNNNASVTYTIPSITSNVSATNYADDTYAETNNLNNTWGYKPSSLYDSTNDTNVTNTDYLPAPTSTVDQTIIAKTDTYNTAGSADGYNIAIGARVDINTLPGEYTNTFVITAVANSIPYTITYNANDGHDGQDTTNMPASPEQEIVDATTPTITLPNNTPARSGYIFKGWCTVQTTDNQATCPGIEYRPGTSLSVDYTTDQIAFYARWVDATLWNAVVDEWELGGSRVQTKGSRDTGIKALITTANSGVFKYNSEVFGADSDNTKSDGTKDDIYYFRGILDSDLDGTSNTGSSGNGETWPNYVRLGDTCWRIVRTTASGGVKMIYNGLYSGGTTTNSCANVGADAQVGTSEFNATNNISERSIIAVGYTFNNNYATTETDTPYGELFGTNEDFSGNTTDSTIKDYIENTWFTSSNGISAYESILEPNAGYCNDRSIYDSEEGVFVNNDYIIEKPYNNDGHVKHNYSGALLRNAIAGEYEDKLPSLNCPRDVADVYTTTTISDGVSTTNGGNGQLGKPVALLTADESSFAGISGIHMTNPSAGSYDDIYTESSETIYTLSPVSRETGHAYLIESTYLGSSSKRLNIGVSSEVKGVRPVTSLVFGTRYTSGTGTAVDPWVVVVP